MWKFIQSSSNSTNWYQHPKKEICFIGRSNVGKSSLINALAKTTIARTSNTPGRTQLVNFFETDDQEIIVDLPGFGFAKMSKDRKAVMLEMIEEYLNQRSQLACVFLLFDSRRGLGDYEFELMEWAKTNNKKLVLVGTKLDKLKQGEIVHLQRQIANESQNFQSVLVSAIKKRNLAQLNQLISKYLN